MKSIFAARIICLILGFSAILLNGGCTGYRLGAVKPSIYADIHRIHVPNFKNATLEPRLSSLVTNAVLKKLQVDGTYQITTRQNCDAILRGNITQIQKSQLRSVRNNTLQSRELSLYLYVSWYLENPTTGERLKFSVDSGNQVDNGAAALSQPGLVLGQTIQFVDQSFQTGERNALAMAAEDAAAKLVSQLAEGW